MGNQSRRVVNVGVFVVWMGSLGIGSGQEPAQADKPERRPTQFVYPISIAADQQQGLFVADLNGHCVWQIKEQKLSLFSFGSRRFRTPLNRVRCVEIDAQGKLLAGDTGAREVYRLDEAGKTTGLTRKKKEDFGIGMPMDIVVDRDGHLLVADLERPGHIWKVPAAGGDPERVVRVNAPRGLALDEQNRLWVVSGRKLLRFDAEYKPQTIVDEGTFSFPHTVVVDPAGTAYVADGYKKTIWKIPADGKPQAWVQGAPLVNPVGLAWRGTQLLVVDPRAKAVFQITSDGKLSSLEFKTDP